MKKALKQVWPIAIIVALALGIMAMFLTYPQKEPNMKLRIFEIVTVLVLASSAVIALLLRHRKKRG